MGKHLTPPGFEPLTSRFITICTTNCPISPIIVLFCNQVYISDKSESYRDHSKMKNKSVKKSFEKSQNVLEEKRTIVEQKICIKNQHVYNNCYELRSRAINNINCFPIPTEFSNVKGKNSFLKRMSDFFQINYWRIFSIIWPLSGFSAVH